MADKKMRAQVSRTRDPAPPDTTSGAGWKALLASNADAIDRALPPHFPGGKDRFVRIVQSAISGDKNPPGKSLADCTPISLIGAAIQAAQLGLTPNLRGQCWMIPRRDGQTGRLEVTFQLGAAGMVALAARAGVHIDVTPIHETDTFEFDDGPVGPTWVHRPGDPTKDPGTATQWLAVARSRANGVLITARVYPLWWVERRKEQGKRANGGRLGPAWTQWPDEMGAAKVAKDFAGKIPSLIEDRTVTAAIVSDGAVRDRIDGTPDEFRTPDDDDSGPVYGDDLGVIEAEVVESDGSDVDRAALAVAIASTGDDPKRVSLEVSGGRTDQTSELTADEITTAVAFLEGATQAEKSAT